MKKKASRKAADTIPSISSFIVPGIHTVCIIPQTTVYAVNDCEANSISSNNYCKVSMTNGMTPEMAASVPSAIIDFSTSKESEAKH